MAETTRAPRNRARRMAPALEGALAGIVAALAMISVQLAARALAGIPTPAELTGDRFAPLIPARDFGGLITWAGGYNELKQLGVLSTLVGQVVTGALGGALYGLLRARPRRAAAFLIGFVVALWLGALVLFYPVLSTSAIGLPPEAARLVTAAWLLASFALFGLTLAILHAFMTRWRGADGAPAPLIGRRGLLTGALGLGLLALSGGLLRRLSDDATFAYDGLQVRGPDIEPITPNERFYVVTKNVIDPNVDAGLWRLSIGGLVDRQMTVDLGTLRAMQSVEQETTLMCISNSISAGLMSNAVWRGVPLRSLIDAAGPGPDAVEVVARSVDSYSDTFAIAKALEPTTLLAYEMNGEPLPRRHGFPVRLLVPGLYGEKSVKWITSVDLVATDASGFYEQQGWGPDFQIQPRARFDGPDFRQPIPVGQTVRIWGTAFGGDRGVSAVEVTVDGGQSWQSARFDYPGSRLTWTLWSFDWRPGAEGDVRLACRATDGQGNVQVAQGRPVVPEGARGHHVVTAMVRA